MPSLRFVSRKLGEGSKKSKLFLALFLFLLIAIPVFLSTKKSTPKQQATAEIQTIVASLNKKVDLPTGTPNIYTVKDVTKLQGQEFFAKAKNGDKVIVYVNAKKAFLYRPTEDKLIEVAYYNPPSPTGTSAVAGASTSEEPSPTQALTPTRIPSPTKTILTPTASPSGNL